MTYNFLKLRDDLTVPSTSTFLHELEGQEYVVIVLVPHGEAPIKLRDEAAQAWIAFEEGSLTVAPNVNGVANIAKAWNDRTQARSLGDTPIEFPISKSFTIKPEPTLNEKVEQYQTNQGRPGGIDYSKVKQRILESAGSV